MQPKRSNNQWQLKVFLLLYTSSESKIHNSNSQLKKNEEFRYPFYVEVPPPHPNSLRESYHVAKDGHYTANCLKKLRHCKVKLFKVCFCWCCLRVNNKNKYLFYLSVQYINWLCFIGVTCNSLRLVTFKGATSWYFESFFDHLNCS